MRAGSIAILNILAGVMSAAALAEPRASGSGFAIGDGSIIITSNHVVEGCSGLNIPDIGPATLLKSDPRADLAILKPNRPLATDLPFRSGHPVKLGEEIVVIGYPLRGLLSSPPTVTTGLVSSLAGLRDDRTQMQISAPVQPGNSGGPVLDRSGNVVGVVESKLDAIKAAVLTGDIPQNVNFAVQSGIVTSLLGSYALNYDFGSFDKEKPISEIVAAALPAIAVVECIGKALPEKAPEREVKRSSTARPIPSSGLNLPTGIYHAKGQRWYGRTKSGAYVCRTEANQAGMRESLNAGNKRSQSQRSSGRTPAARPSVALVSLEPGGRSGLAAMTDPVPRLGGSY